jgi:hypothetical protein
MEAIAHLTSNNYKRQPPGNSQYRTAGKGSDPGGDFVDKCGVLQLPGFPSGADSHRGGSSLSDLFSSNI